VAVTAPQAALRAVLQGQALLLRLVQPVLQVQRAPAPVRLPEMQ
jgi:hypothetical protein